jgi:hypothetical protein
VSPAAVAQCRALALDAWTRLNASDPLTAHRFLCQHAAAFAALGFTDDHSIETCRATFQNTKRFEGFPAVQARGRL